MGDATGIIYNNEIDDFSFGNGTDKYGLSVNPGNKVQAGNQQMNASLFM